MLIRPEIDPRYKAAEIHVCKNELDDEVRGVIAELHIMFDEVFTGTDEAGNRCQLKPSGIISFYAEGQRVFALDAERRYSITKKLYELEETLGAYGFVRISKAELINFKKIKSMDMSITGTIRITMKGGYETYASRRNVSKIRDLLRKEKEA